MLPPRKIPVPNPNDVLLDPPDDGEVVDPMAWFDSPGPFEIEIGSGKGGFLLSRAKVHPQRRFLGIEWAMKYARSSADRMARWNLANVRVMRTDARYFFLNHLPPGCVDTLHLYHPDPWPKARHHKRRLVQGEQMTDLRKEIRELRRIQSNQWWICRRALWSCWYTNWRWQKGAIPF